MSRHNSKPLNRLISNMASKSRATVSSDAVANSLNAKTSALSSSYSSTEGSRFSVAGKTAAGEQHKVGA